MVYSCDLKNTDTFCKVYVIKQCITNNYLYEPSNYLNIFGDILLVSSAAYRLQSLA